MQVLDPDGVTLHEYIALTDDRGTIMGTVDPATGNVLERIHYNATGIAKVFDHADQPILRPDGRNLGHSQFIPFGYTGMYKESFTGFLHTHFRDYDPIHRTWLSEDPAGYVDGLNLNKAYFDVNGADVLGLDNEMSWALSGTPDYAGQNGILSWLWNGRAQGGASSRPGAAALKSRTLMFNDKELLLSQLENEAFVNNLYAIHNGGTEAGRQIAMEAATSPLSALGVGVVAKLSKKGFVLVKNSKGAMVLGKKLRSGAVKYLPSSVSRRILKETSEEVAAKFGDDFFETIALQATRNASSDTLVLGHFSRKGTSYQKVAAHYKATYFKVDDWNSVTKGLSQDEIWRINETFLEQQLSQGKRVLFSHDPIKARKNSFFEKEVEYMKALGFKFVQKNQWTWEAVK